MNYMILMNIATFLVIVYVVYSYFLYKKFFLNPMFFFLLGYLLFLGFPAFFRDDQTVYDERYLKLSIITFLSLFGFVLGWFLYNTKRILYQKEVESYNKKLNLTSKYKIILFLLFIVGISMQYFSLKAVGIPMVSKLIAMRSGIDTAQNIYETFYRFPYTFSFSVINTTSIILILDSFGKKYSSWYKIILVIVFIIAFLVSFATGTRMNVFVYVMPIILYYMFITHRKIDIKKIIIIFIAGFSIFMAMLVQSNIRNSGIESIGVAKLKTSELTEHGLDQAPDMIKIFDDYPARKDFLMGETFAALLVNPIPREYYPNKPVGLGAILGTIDPITRKGISISVTIFGELYVNFGYFGFLVALIFGYLMKVWFVYFVRHVDNLKNIILYFHSLPFFSIEFRGDFLSQSMMYLMQLLILLLIFKLMPKIGKQR